jgi:hypothetical protein
MSAARPAAPPNGPPSATRRESSPPVIAGRSLATVHSRVDRILERLKWPSAFVALLATPLLLWSLVCLASDIVATPTFSLLPFAVGGLSFALVWRRWLGIGRLGAFVVTLEHEATHAIFALLTGHRIVGFRASLSRGGAVRFAGKGNWIITAAPYFFPTAAIILFLLAYFLPFASLPWQSFMLGVALAYHVISTRRETHRDQSDLKALGTTFCWMFLPAANLAVVGLLVSFAHGGTEGSAQWLSHLVQPAQWAFVSLGNIRWAG